MFVPCPHCGFLVSLIVPPHGPSQRCPRCDGALPVDSSAAVNAPEPTDDAGALAAGDAGSDNGSGANTESGIVPAMDLAPAADHPTDSAMPAVAAQSKMPPAPTDPSARVARTRRSVPSFVRGTAVAKAPRRAWRWYAAIVALVVLLALQLLLAQRAELAASARWRPWVAGLCSALQCEIPAWHEPRAYTMLSRSVQPSPTMPGVLSVEANFRNDARWPQPWPTLMLTLSDIEGRDVGKRAFAPSEYRDRKHDSADRLAPGQSATVRLQVREPAPRIVAFTFDFH